MRARIQAPLQPEHPSGHGMLLQHPAPRMVGMEIISFPGWGFVTGC